MCLMAISDLIVVTLKNPAMARQVMLLLLLLAMFSKGLAMVDHMKWPWGRESPAFADTASYCLSWRLAVESNNMRGWPTIPTSCSRHIEAYMLGGQYSKDINLIVEQIYAYLDGIPLLDDGMDAWILDVDDTCLSNVFYYRGKRFGCDPYNPIEFRAWASRGQCVAIPSVLEMFNRLIGAGFKVFLLTGRDEETLGQATAVNLQDQGFIGYERLIMRSTEYRGQSAITFKSNVRKQLKQQGYRIWGNVGDQWSDLQGDCTGNRTFKVPNPMYFVP